MKLPTYKQIKESADEDLMNLYWELTFKEISDDSDKLFKKSRAVKSELVKRKLGYFDGISKFHLNSTRRV